MTSLLYATLVGLGYTVVMTAIFVLIRRNIREMAPIRAAYLGAYQRASALTQALRTQGDFDPNEPEDAKPLMWLAPLLGLGFLFWCLHTIGQPAIWLIWALGTGLALAISVKLVDTKGLLLPR